MLSSVRQAPDPFALGFGTHRCAFLEVRPPQLYTTPPAGDETSPHARIERGPSGREIGNRPMKASAASWKLRKPFAEGVPLPYQAVFNAEEYARVQEGFIPEVMEDKWFIFYEEPHLFFYRSWTGEPVYRIKLTTVSNGAEISEALWSKHLSSAPGADPAYQARLLEFLLSNLLLGQSKPFPQPAHLKDHPPGLYQHAVAGTAYPSVPAQTRPPQPPAAKKPQLPNPKKPWWRFW
jgi:hypothetical protein